jgi:hypothetical protein
MKVIYTEEFKRDARKVKDKKIQGRIKKGNVLIYNSLL